MVRRVQGKPTRSTAHPRRSCGRWLNGGYFVVPESPKCSLSKWAHKLMFIYCIYVYIYIYIYVLWIQFPYCNSFRKMGFPILGMRHNTHDFCVSEISTALDIYPTLRMLTPTLLKSGLPAIIRFQEGIAGRAISELFQVGMAVNTSSLVYSFWLTANCLQRLPHFWDLLVCWNSSRVQFFWIFFCKISRRRKDIGSQSFTSITFPDPATLPTSPELCGQCFNGLSLGDPVFRKDQLFSHETSPVWTLPEPLGGPTSKTWETGQEQRMPSLLDVFRAFSGETM